MNNAIGQSFPRDDIVRKGPALCRTGKFGVQHECRLILRGYVAPFRLEVYAVVSSVGKVYSLENVKHIKYDGPFDQNAVSLKIEFRRSLSLYFTFLTEREATEWTEAIQMRSLDNPRHVTLTNLEKFQVNLMPNPNCHLNGYYMLDVTDDAIRISDACGTASRIVWPVQTIRFYSYRGKLFSVATASCSETGEGVFHLDALCTKKSEFLYECVAALVSRMLKVAAAAVGSVPHPPSPRLPDSVPLQSVASVIYNRLAAECCNGGESISASSSESCSTSLDDKEAFVLNSFYLKRLGMSIEKLTKAPDIYGLCQPKRELLETFTSARNPLERLTCSAILYGPSNCGKRLLVEAVAVHWSATLLCIPAKCLLQLDRDRDAGIEMLLDVAMVQAPCIILIKHLENILPSSSLSAAEAGCASRVLQKVEDAFRAKKIRGVGFVGTISNLSEVNLPLPPFHWMDRKIYVPPPCLETRHEVFAKELQDLLSSPEDVSCLSLLAQSTAGFDFIQLMDLYRDVRKVAVSDALDGESRNGRCVMRIRDLTKVKQVVNENASERRVYEESGLSTARYYAILHQSEEPALFVVKLIANEALPGVSHCFLRILDSSVDLRDLDPMTTIVSWQFTTIRRHTWTPLTIVLETGRKSQTDAGEFHFETIAAKTISDLLQKRLEAKKMELETRR